MHTHTYSKTHKQPSQSMCYLHVYDLRVDPWGWITNGPVLPCGRSFLSQHFLVDHSSSSTVEAPSMLDVHWCCLCSGLASHKLVTVQKSRAQGLFPISCENAGGPVLYRVCAFSQLLCISLVMPQPCRGHVQCSSSPPPPALTFFSSSLLWCSLSLKEFIYTPYLWLSIKNHLFSGLWLIMG